MSLVRLFTKFAKAEDLIAFLISAFISYLVASLLPAGPWANYTFILLFYHLFLAWLVFEADHEKGFSLPIVSTILTHLACLAVVVTVIFGLAGPKNLLFLALRFSVASLAFFERNWLLGAAVTKQITASPMAAAFAAEAAEATATTTAEEYAEWLSYLSKRDPRSVKSGVTVKDEYEQWIVARARKRAAASPITSQANANPA